MLIPNFILVVWSLIFGMTDEIKMKEKILRYALSHIKKAQVGKLTGNLNFTFHNGMLIKTETNIVDKPNVENLE